MAQTLSPLPAPPVAAQAEERNFLLRALSPTDYADLQPLLVHEPLPVQRVLVEPDTPIARVFFPISGVCSLIRDQQAGGAIEAATVGHEGFVGVPLLMASDRMSSRVISQVSGEGTSVSAREFRDYIASHPDAHRLFLRYAHYFTELLAQSVACNRLHTLEERCARWLLMTDDRTDQQPFELTHEFLSFMLGVRRAGVTVAMGALQHAGIIRYSRGRVTVLDRGKLREAACDCYGITRKALDRLYTSSHGDGGAS